MLENETKMNVEEEAFRVLNRCQKERRDMLYEGSVEIVCITSVHEISICAACGCSGPTCAGEQPGSLGIMIAPQS